uniref:POU domain, class 2, transcription factor 2 n=1 Tax=Syphacia muris TaxID=451379 RepID=A0A0N5AFW4_9BILA
MPNIQKSSFCPEAKENETGANDDATAPESDTGLNPANSQPVSSSSFSKSSPSFLHIKALFFFLDYTHIL